jgi:hypothetical protein
MKQGEVLFLLTVFLVILIMTIGCTYVIPENSGVREYSTLSPLVEKEMPDFNRQYSTHPPDKYDKAPVLKHESNTLTVDFYVLPGGDYCVGMNIFFDARVSGTPVEDYLEYYWDFGDGSRPFGPTRHNPVCHTFLISDDYTVRLTVIDNSGGFSVKEKLIHIRDF